MKITELNCKNCISRHCNKCQDGSNYKGKFPKIDWNAFFAEMRTTQQINPNDIRVQPMPRPRSYRERFEERAARDRAREERNNYLRYEPQWIPSDMNNVTIRVPNSDINTSDGTITDDQGNTMNLERNSDNEEE